MATDSPKKTRVTLEPPPSNTPKDGPDKLRLDQQLVLNGHKAIQVLLDLHPELRSVVIVYDYVYDEDKNGALPDGVWLARDDKITLRALRMVHQRVHQMCNNLWDSLSKAIDSLLRQVEETTKNVRNVQPREGEAVDESVQSG
jgi:hypothetical protein